MPSGVLACVSLCCVISSRLSVVFVFVRTKEEGGRRKEEGGRTKD